MHIFIDESGIFKRDRTKPQSIACVGAAIIPGRNLGRVERAFRRLSESWPRSPRGEIKGRLLGERQVADLCALLEPADVLFEASVMDMNMSDDEDIDRDKAIQAKRFTESLTEKHHPQVVRGVWELRRTLEQMHRQLYAQAMALTDVAWKAVQYGQLYYCLRFPGELAHFRWVIDAKEKRRTTRYERWWRTSVAPLLQSRSLRNPLIKLNGGDYSAFRRNFSRAPLPDQLRPNGNGPKEWGEDIGAIIGREMQFATSDAHIGLQIADILTNALRRALLGHLQPAGWRPLGGLPVRRPEGAITLLGFNPPKGRVKRSYAGVIKELNGTGRSLLEIKRGRHS